MPHSEDVLERNDLVYEVLPPQWVFGLPIGNGQVGGMVWVEDETKIIVTLDSVWAWDHRLKEIEDPARDNYARFRQLMDHGDEQAAARTVAPGGPQPQKTYVGRLVIDVGRRVTGTARLCLRDAEVAVELSTDPGDRIDVRAVAYANVSAISVEIEPRSGVREVRLERLLPERVGLGSVENPTQGRTSGVEWIRQDIPDSPSIVLALREDGNRAFATVQVTREGRDPVDAAVEVLEKAVADPAGHQKDHRDHWRQFWERSAIQVPDAKIETLWYMGLYMLSSASRAGGTAPSLHGIWSPDGCMPPAHGFYIWDFYSQHWGLYTANHLEIGDVFCDHFLSMLPRLKEQTKRFYGWDGVFVPGFMIVDGSWLYAGHTQLLLWPGTSAWVAQAFWWQYLYNQDVDFLRDKAYPFMRECMLFYERRLEKGDDGRYHFYVSYAPEWRSWVNDDALSLSLVRYLIRGLLQAVDTLGIDEPHAAQWAEILENLQEYHREDGVLDFAENLPYTESHRHMSHLAPVYPCDDLNVDGTPVDQRLIDNTINRVILKGYGTFVGWAFVWLSAIAARAGRGQMAWWTLRQCADSFVACNTYNLNLDWERNGISTQTDTLCVDGNMGAVDSVNQMLLQSWGGRIRVFPACPSHWRVTRFDDLLTEGGVQVSAVRADGRTIGVRLESDSPRRVRLLNPFGLDGGYLVGRPIRPNDDGDLIVELEPGSAVWLTSLAYVSSNDLDAVAVSRPEEDRNPYGLKYLDEGWLAEGPDIPHVHPHFRELFVK